MKVFDPTMGKSKCPAGKSLYPLKIAIGAFLGLPLGPGFAAFPDLIDKDLVEKSMLQLRQTFYFEALNVITRLEPLHSLWVPTVS
jgi:hypothetical protein